MAVTAPVGAMAGEVAAAAAEEALWRGSGENRGQRSGARRGCATRACAEKTEGGSTGSKSEVGRRLG